MKLLGSVLLAAGILLGLVFFYIRNMFLGVGFLMRFMSAGFFFIAFAGFLCLPWKSCPIEPLILFLRRFTAICLVLFAISFIAIEGLIYTHRNGTPSPDAEIVIVLGAGLYGETPSATLVSRLDTALAYLNTHPQSIAVLSGGQGPNEWISEALGMQRYLSARGIDPSRLLLEETSTSTAENLTFSLDLLSADFPARPLSAVIVTNDFHLYRSGRLAESIGFSPQLLSAKTPQIGLVPISLYIREYFSVLKMFFTFFIG